MNSPVLLSDDQVRRYVADGFIMINSGLERAHHDAVTTDLSYALAHEPPMLGDNVVPRVPLLQEVLDSPAVKGAMISLLGENFVWAPHRFPHNSEPLELACEVTDPLANQLPMGKGSIAGSGWHQDGHYRAGRSRWPTFRAANVFYFPHDTPKEMGVTRFLAGTHLYANLYDILPEQVVFQDISAGTVIVGDFDLGHAATPNNTDTSRYMVKFVALRTQTPAAAVWNHEEARWKTPDNLFTPFMLPVVWSSLWNWLRGVPRNENIELKDQSMLPELLTGLRERDQSTRLNSLYDISNIGTKAVDSLISMLSESGGQERHSSPPAGSRGFVSQSEDHLERKFSQRQFVPEDASIALAAIGAPAVPYLVELLGHDDPWIRMNAAYALGDAGPAAAGHVADKVGELLDDPLESVVRVVADALCCIPTFSAVTVARIHRHLIQKNLQWQVKAMGEGVSKVSGNWTVENQIRYVCTWALLARVSMDNPPQEIEAALIDALGDETGFTQGIATEGLKRLGTNSALRAAVDFLQVHRWDNLQQRYFREDAEAAIN